MSASLLKIILVIVSRFCFVQFLSRIVVEFGDYTSLSEASTIRDPVRGNNSAPAKDYDAEKCSIIEAVNRTLQVHIR